MSKDFNPTSQSSEPSWKLLAQKLASSSSSPFDQIQPSPYSDQEKTFFKYLSAVQQCEKHVSHLKIHEWDERETANNKFRYPHEKYWIFMSMCLQNELLTTPSCLVKNKNFTTRNFTPQHTDMKQLFHDLQQCAHVEMIHSKNHHEIPQFEHVFENDSDFENHELLLNYGKSLRSTTLKQNFPSFYYYFTVEPLSPEVINLAYGTALPYCRTHVLKCLKQHFNEEKDDAVVIEHASLDDTMECLKQQPCTLKILPFLDHEKEMQSKQAKSGKSF